MSDSTYLAHLLRVGIAAAKAGQKEAARQTLLKVTELDERNERGVGAGQDAPSDRPI